MNNDEMDEQILARLKLSVATLNYIHMTLELPGHASNHHQLCGRMQALKKDGKIVYLLKKQGGPGWCLAGAEPEAVKSCPHICEACKGG